MAKYSKGKNLIVTNHYYKISKSNISINMDNETNRRMMEVAVDNFANATYNGQALSRFAESHGISKTDIFEIAIKEKYLLDSMTVNPYKLAQQIKLKIGRNHKEFKRLAGRIKKGQATWSDKRLFNEMIDTSGILFEYKKGAMRINLDSPYLDRFMQKVQKYHYSKYNDKLKESKFGESVDIMKLAKMGLFK